MPFVLYPVPYLTRATAPVSLPADVADLLQRFRLTLPGLLTDSNPKLNKGDGRAVILHHLPARALAAAITPTNVDGIPARSYLPGLAALAESEGLTAAALAHNGCPWASGCGHAAGGCLVWSGHGGLSAAVAEARGRRTLAMLADPATYGRAVLWAIAWHHRRAAAAGQVLAVRLRGTDDTAWHRVRVTVSHAETVRLSQRFGLHTVTADAESGGATLADLAGHAVRFYDYSKADTAGPLGLSAQAAAGWDITASMRADAPDAVTRALLALRAGFRLAVPVDIRKGQPIPESLTLRSEAGTITVPCIDGDAHDHRYRDPEGVAVILRAKRARGSDPAVTAPFFLSAPPVPAAGLRMVSTLADGTAALNW